MDGNQHANVDQAIRRARLLLEAFDIAWYEEPLPADDLVGHVRLSASTTIPIAVGEFLYSLQHFRGSTCSMAVRAFCSLALLESRHHPGGFRRPTLLKRSMCVWRRIS